MTKTAIHLIQIPQKIVAKLLASKIGYYLLSFSFFYRLFNLCRTPQVYYQNVNKAIANEKALKTKQIGFQSASFFERKLPISIDPNIHESFLKEEFRAGQDIFAYEIADARVWGAQGTVITPDNKVIIEFSKEFRSRPEEFSIFQQPFLPRPKLIQGSTILLAAPAGQVYGHWLMDVLTRLAVLERLGFNWRQGNHFFVNGVQRAFQRRSLELLGIPESKWISGVETPHIQCERLIAPSQAGMSGNLPDWAVGWLREKFLPHAQDPELGKKVFILRTQTVGRRLLNQVAISKTLESYGFASVTLESLSFEEQIGVFANAEIVIGANGSGMFNIIFCKQGTKVIELFGDSSVNVCQWAASQSVSLNYAYLVGLSHKVNGMHPHACDYEINVSALMKLIEKIGTQNQNR
jgi:capsular polysaccharide biosynthesis protein